VSAGTNYAVRGYNLNFVIPAKAGIHLLTSGHWAAPEMDSRLRGNDERKGRE